jgi:hypothetical protein
MTRLRTKLNVSNIACESEDYLKNFLQDSNRLKTDRTGNQAKRFWMLKKEVRGRTIPEGPGKCNKN